MFVCICRAVTERELDSAIEQGANTVEAVSECTGAGTDCGSCQNALAARVKRACARPNDGPVESRSDCH